MLELLLPAFIMGVLSAGHCMGMCGGIAAGFAVGSGRSHASDTGGANSNPPGNGSESASANIGNSTSGSMIIAKSSTVSPNAALGARALFYNLGRVSTYVLLGVIVGVIGYVIELSTIGLLTRYIAAGFMVALGAYIGGWWVGLTTLESFGGRLWAHVSPYAQNLIPARRWWQALALGLLWGLLPCGLVYSALALALAHGDAKLSALHMLFFGLGTIPSMFASFFFGEGLRRALVSAGLRRALGTCFILYGVWLLLATILFSMDHHGHAAMMGEHGAGEHGPGEHGHASERLSPPNASPAPERAHQH